MLRFKELTEERKGVIARAIVKRLVSYPHAEFEDVLRAERSAIIEETSGTDEEFASFICGMTPELIVRHTTNRLDSDIHGLPSACPNAP